MLAKFYLEWCGPCDVHIAGLCGFSPLHAPLCSHLGSHTFVSNLGPFLYWMARDIKLGCRITSEPLCTVCLEVMWMWQIQWVVDLSGSANDCKCMRQLWKLHTGVEIVCAQMWTLIEDDQFQKGDSCHVLRQLRYFKLLVHLWFPKSRGECRNRRSRSQLGSRYGIAGVYCVMLSY